MSHCYKTYLGNCCETAGFSWVLWNESALNKSLSMNVFECGALAFIPDKSEPDTDRKVMLWPTQGCTV
jgi:hypothetical protein